MRGLVHPGRPTRRALLAGAVGALASACARGAAAPAAVPLSRFGVDRFSTRDQWAALKHAFESAAADHLSLVADPDATYRHDGVLTLDGVSFDGQGCRFLALSDGQQTLRLLGAGWRVANLRVLGVGTVRASNDLCNGIFVGDAGEHSATDFRLENVTVDAAEPGRGVAAAGILFRNAHRGHVVAPVVRHSLSDGIHMTEGSTDLVIERPLVEDSGDDSVAVVSYRQQGRVCRNIRVTDAITRRSAARGFSVVGGVDITYERIRAEQSAAAGLYFYSEGGFDTYGVLRARAIDAVVRDCSTGRGQSGGFSNAAIIIGGRDGSDDVEGMTLTRAATDCLLQRPTVIGGGAACTAAISTHQYAVRPRIVGARIQGAAPGRPGLPTAGLEIGGRDVVVDHPRMTDIMGLAVSIRPTVSGHCELIAPQVDGSLLRPGPIGSFIYAEGAPGLQQFVIRDGRFTRGPRRLSIDLMPPGRLRLERNRTD